MSLTNPIYAVVGSGAVGCYYGGRLASVGQDVHFLFRSDYDHVAANGLTVRSWQGDFHVRVKTYRETAAMPPADVILVALKSAAMDAFPALVAPLLKENTLVLCMLNGLGHEEQIASIAGPDHVLAGAPFICSEKIGPGLVEHTASGGVRIAPWRVPLCAGSIPLPALAESWEAAGISCKLHDNPYDVKWGKLLWNVPFSGLSVFYAGATTDVILGDPVKRAFAERLMREVILAATADGVTLDPGLVAINFASTAKMGAYRTSMLVDYIAGRPIEHEAILGEPLKRGERAGLELPAMRELYEGVNRRIQRAD